MGAPAELTARVEASLLEGTSIRRVIEVRATGSGNDLVIGAKIDLAPELTMSEVSVILLQAKRRVVAAAPEANGVFLEPDVWVDPNAAQPPTSAVVTLSYD